MHGQVREPAVAGLFYPSDKQECDREVADLLAQNPFLEDLPIPKALIAPHAGYIYSGAIAAKAYNLLARHASLIKRVVLMGPCHRVPLDGIAVSSAEYFRTPLGNVAIDIEAVKHLLQLPQISLADIAHQYEHSLEVHLPFLQKVLNQFVLVPLVVGHSTAEQVAEALDAYWQDEATLIVVSSDLSHYLSYENARKVDANTSHAIENCSCNLSGEQACGCYAVNGLLFGAKNKGRSVTCLSLANSGDTAGDKNRVVGYGAYAIH